MGSAFDGSTNFPDSSTVRTLLVHSYMCQGIPVSLHFTPFPAILDNFYRWSLCQGTVPVPDSSCPRPCLVILYRWPLCHRIAAFPDFTPLSTFVRYFWRCIRYHGMAPVPDSTVRASGFLVHFGRCCKYNGISAVPNFTLPVDFYRRTMCLRLAAISDLLPHRALLLFLYGWISGHRNVFLLCFPLSCALLVNSYMQVLSRQNVVKWALACMKPSLPLRLLAFRELFLREVFFLYRLDLIWFYGMNFLDLILRDSFKDSGLSTIPWDIVWLWVVNWFYHRTGWLWS